MFRAHKALKDSFRVIKVTFHEIMIVVFMSYDNLSADSEHTTLCMHVVKYKIRKNIKLFKMPVTCRKLVQRT